MEFQRIFAHLTLSSWQVDRCFPRATRQRIEQAIAETEKLHCGELRCVVEGGLPLSMLLSGLTSRERAADLFSRLRVWDTAGNSGILIYVQLADRRVEILADRGIASKVPQSFWDSLCGELNSAFAAGRYESAVLNVIRQAGDALVEHFPAGAENPNELPDRPLVLGGRA